MLPSKRLSQGENTSDNISEVVEEFCIEEPNMVTGDDKAEKPRQTNTQNKNDLINGSEDALSASRSITLMKLNTKSLLDTPSGSYDNASTNESNIVKKLTIKKSQLCSDKMLYNSTEISPSPNFNDNRFMISPNVENLSFHTDGIVFQPRKRNKLHPLIARKSVSLGGTPIETTNRSNVSRQYRFNEITRSSSFINKKSSSAIVTKKRYKKKYEDKVYGSEKLTTPHRSDVNIRKSTRVPKAKVDSDFITWTEDDPNKRLNSNSESEISADKKFMSDQSCNEEFVSKSNYTDISSITADANLLKSSEYIQPVSSSISEDIVKPSVATNTGMFVETSSTKSVTSAAIDSLNYIDDETTMKSDQCIPTRNNSRSSPTFKCIPTESPSCESYEVSNEQMSKSGRKSVRQKKVNKKFYNDEYENKADSRKYSDNISPTNMMSDFRDEDSKISTELESQQCKDYNSESPGTSNKLNSSEENMSGCFTLTDGKLVEVDVDPQAAVFEPVFEDIESRSLTKIEDRSIYSMSRVISQSLFKSPAKVAAKCIDGESEGNALKSVPKADLGSKLPNKNTGMMKKKKAFGKIVTVRRRKLSMYSPQRRHKALPKKSGFPGLPSNPRNTMKSNNISLPKKKASKATGNKKVLPSSRPKRNSKRKSFSDFETDLPDKTVTMLELINSMKPIEQVANTIDASSVQSTNIKGIDSSREDLSKNKSTVQINDAKLKKSKTTIKMTKQRKNQSLKVRSAIKKNHDVGRPTFRCTFCPLLCRSESKYLAHLSQHKGVQELDLESHAVNVTGNGVARSLKCPKCPYSCAIPSTLSNHMRHHEQQKKLIFCPFCSLKFNSRSEFVKHQIDSHSTEDGSDEDFEPSLKDSVPKFSSNKSKDNIHNIEVTSNENKRIESVLTKDDGRSVGMGELIQSSFVLKSPASKNVAKSPLTNKKSLSRVSPDKFVTSTTKNPGGVTKRKKMTKAMKRLQKLKNYAAARKKAALEKLDIDNKTANNKNKPSITTGSVITLKKPKSLNSKKMSITGSQSNVSHSDSFSTNLSESIVSESHREANSKVLTPNEKKLAQRKNNINSSLSSIAVKDESVTFKSLMEIPKETINAKLNTKSSVVEKTEIQNLVSKPHSDEYSFVHKLQRCTLCNFSTWGQSMFAIHLHRHRIEELGEQLVDRVYPAPLDVFDGKIYRCSLCHWFTPKKSTYTFHVNAHKKVDYAFKIDNLTCRICKKIFDDEKLCSEHLLTEHENDEKLPLFSCTSCSFEAEKQEDVDRHLLTHKISTFKSTRSEDKISIYGCTFCPFKTAYQSSFYRHRVRFPDAKSHTPKIIDKVMKMCKGKRGHLSIEKTKQKEPKTNKKLVEQPIKKSKPQKKQLKSQKSAETFSNIPVRSTPNIVDSLIQKIGPELVADSPDLSRKLDSNKIEAVFGKVTPVKRDLDDSSKPLKKRKISDPTEPSDKIAKSNSMVGLGLEMNKSDLADNIKNEHKTIAPLEPASVENPHLQGISSINETSKLNESESSVKNVSRISGSTKSDVVQLVPLPANRFKRLWKCSDCPFKSFNSLVYKRHRSFYCEKVRNNSSHK